MHLVIILAALGVAVFVRVSWQQTDGGAPVSPLLSWHLRWRTALTQFLLPPLLLLMTAIAILWMGPRGQMVWQWEGWCSYTLAASYLGSAVLLGLQLVAAGWRSLQQVRQYPQIEIEGQRGRYLGISLPYAAQVGFWQPELVVSQGLLEILNPDQLRAVLVHEQAHRHYHDPFCFLGLGWLRRLTLWLPRTEALWQELLVLRELRADRWAMGQVDGLLLAESLYLMTKTPQIINPDQIYAAPVCTAFAAAVTRDRLTERIDALLSTPETDPQPNPWYWSWLLLTGLPLMAVPFHY